MKDNDYYHLIKQLSEVKDLLGEVLKRLGKLEYSGFVEYGDSYHSSQSKKYIKVTLNRDKKEISSPNPYGDDDYATPEDIDLFPGP